MIYQTSNTKVEDGLSEQFIDNGMKCGIIRGCFPR